MYFAIHDNTYRIAIFAYPNSTPSVFWNFLGSGGEILNGNITGVKSRTSIINWDRYPLPLIL